MSGIEHFERLCADFYGASDPTRQAYANQKLTELSSQIDSVPQLCQLVLLSRNQGAIVYASSSLVKLVTSNWVSISEEVKQTFLKSLLTHLYEQTDTLLSSAPQSIVYLVRLMARLVKLGWLDSPKNQTIFEDMRPFFAADYNRFIMGLDIWAELICDMRLSPGTHLARNRRITMSFRDVALPLIAESNVLMIMSMVQGVCVTSTGFKRPTEVQPVTLPAQFMASLDQSKVQQVIKKLLGVFTAFMSFDFLGACPDEAFEDSTTVMITKQFTFMADLKIPSVLFQIYGGALQSGNKAIAVLALQGAVLVASIRKSFYETPEIRTEVTKQWLNSSAQLLQSRAGLDHHECLHEFCRLLGRLKAGESFKEFLETAGFIDWLSQVCEFTISALQSKSIEQNTSSFLVRFWSSLSPAVSLALTPTTIKSTLDSSDSVYDISVDDVARVNNLSNQIQSPSLAVVEMIKRVINAYVDHLLISLIEAEDDEDDDVDVHEELDTLAALSSCCFDHTAYLLVSRLWSLPIISKCIAPTHVISGQTYEHIQSIAVSQEVVAAFNTSPDKQPRAISLVLLLAGSLIATQGEGTGRKTVRIERASSALHVVSTLTTFILQVMHVMPVVRHQRFNEARAVYTGPIESLNATTGLAMMTCMLDTVDPNRALDKLLLSYLGFLESIRRVYLLEHMRKSQNTSVMDERVKSSLAETLGFNDDDDIVTIIASGVVDILIKCQQTMFIVVRGMVTPPRIATWIDYANSFRDQWFQSTQNTQFPLHEEFTRNFNHWLNPAVSSFKQGHAYLPSEKVVQRAIMLLSDLCSSVTFVEVNDNHGPCLVQSGQLINRNHLVSAIVQNHAELVRGLTVGIGQQRKLGKFRTRFYHTLTKLVLLETKQDTNSFFEDTFCKPMLDSIDELRRSFQSGSTSEHMIEPYVNLCRDLTGVSVAIITAQNYQRLFKLLTDDPRVHGNSRLTIFVSALSVWGNNKNVIKPTLKFLAELSHNRQSRITFENNSPAGMLLFREACKVVYGFGEKVLKGDNMSLSGQAHIMSGLQTIIPTLGSSHQSTTSKDKVKFINLLVKLFYNSLTGNFANLGLFELYGDPILSQSLNTAVRLAVSIPPTELMAYPKHLKTLFGFIELVAKAHMQALIEADGLVHFLHCLEEGLTSFDTSVALQACTALDHIASFIWERRESLMTGQAVTKKDATIGGNVDLQVLHRCWLVRGEQAIQVMKRLMWLVCQLLVSGEFSSTWSLSRPLLPLIFMDRGYFGQLAQTIVTSQVSTKRREDIQTALLKLLESVNEDLSNKNREVFTKNVYDLSQTIKTV